VNHTQALVLAFMALAWLAVIAILVIEPGIYDQALRLTAADALTARAAFLVALTVFIGFICLGVLRRWRWTFWLLLIAFFFGVLRVPASMLELTGTIPASGPTWYVVFQAVIGVVQFAIGLVMLAEYRRSGVWGRVRPAAQSPAQRPNGTR
jgi:hypothetical protein